MACESIDPKKQNGDMKCPMQLLPMCALMSAAWVMGLGANKYGPWNWRSSGGVCASTYVGAILRHLAQWVGGEDIDEESGQSHLAHIIATCCILLDADASGSLVDDRSKVNEANKKEV